MQASFNGINRKVQLKPVKWGLAHVGSVAAVAAVAVGARTPHVRASEGSVQVRVSVGSKQGRVQCFS